ncbi:DUF6602 domain-containing protein [Legionella pneumophila serogroup 8]
MYKKFLNNMSEEALRIYQTIIAEYNFDLGDEFEFALCRFLRIVLPKKYSICRGFIVDKNDSICGDDIIIYDDNLFPRLRLTEYDFTVKQYVPYDAVYAYIEVKHKIDPKSLSKAFKQSGDVKKLYRDKRLLSETDFGNIGQGISVSSQPGWPEFRNPIYTGIIARHIDVATPADLANLITESGTKCELAPDLIIADSKFVCLPTIADKLESPFFISEKSKLSVVKSNASIGIGICSLLLALNYIHLKPINYKQLMAEEVNASYIK